MHYFLSVAALLPVAVTLSTSVPLIGRWKSHRSDSNEIPFRKQLGRFGTIEDTTDFPSKQHQQQQQQQTFLTPLLQEFEWGPYARTPGQRPPNQSNDEDSDNELLDFLPWFVQPQTPRPKQMIAQVTRQYVYGDTRGDPRVNVTELLKVVTEEYKCADVPLKMGSQVYNLERNHTHRKVTQILSFAAHHRLPMEITSLLFGDADDDNNELLEYKKLFIEHGGWDSVSFPRGLAVRLPRNRLASKLDRYQPIPRQWLLLRNQRAAVRAVKESTQVKPPRQRFHLSREAFLSSLETEMKISSQKNTNSKYNPSPFFPTRRNVFKFINRRFRRVQSIWRLVSFRLSQSIRATVLSYGLLAWAWYNASIIWQYTRLPVTFGLSTAAASATSVASAATTVTAVAAAAAGVGNNGLALLGPSFRRVGGVMMDVYFSPVLRQYITNWTVICLVLVLAPGVHVWLQSYQRKLDTTENAALLRMGTMLAATHVSIGASLFFLDAALLQVLVLL